MRAPLALALAVPVLAVSACGSGGAKTLDRSALDAKANAICTTFAAKFKALSATYTPTGKQDLGVTVEGVHALSQKRDADLAALKPDDKTKQQWDAFIAAARASTDIIGQIEAAAKTPEGTGLNALVAKAQPLGTKYHETATAVGADVCAKPVEG